MQETQETWVQSVGWEDPPEKGMTTHSSILPWRIPWIKEPGRLQPIESQRVRHNWKDLAHMHCTHVQIWELDHKEGWVPKNWCFRITVLKKTLEGPLASKEVKPVNPKENQPWIFCGRTDAEAPIIWPPDVKSQLTGEDPDAGRAWRHEEKGMTEDQMVGWHHLLNGHEFEQTPGDSDGQESLVCCSPRSHKELGMT